MYLHIGQSTVIKSENIVAVLDLDNSTVSRHTRKWLNNKQKNNNVINVSLEELPKSVIVYDDKGKEVVYICQLSPATIIKRISSCEYFNV